MESLQETLLKEEAAAASQTVSFVNFVNFV